MLVGSQAAFDAVGNVTQERMAEAMKSMPMPEPTGEFKKFLEWLKDDDLPFS